MIVRAWHPSIKEGKSIATNVSDVVAGNGISSYQLSTGEIVEV